MTSTANHPSEIQYNELLEILAQANQIASSTELEDLLDRMLGLIIQVCGANAGTLYLLDKESNELVFSVVHGEQSSQGLVGTRISDTTGIVGAAVQEKQVIIIEDLENDPRFFRSTDHPTKIPLQNTISVPLKVRGEIIAVIQVFNYSRTPIQVIELLGSRMASELEKTLLLKASEDREDRLEALVDIVGKIGATLDQDLILRMIIEYAHRLLNAEGSSLFLLDPHSGDFLLYLSSNPALEKQEAIRVPAGEGIVSQVLKTGESIRVRDATQDPSHYRGIDDISGMQTKSLLAVPMSAKPVSLGQDRGTMDEEIIGVLEAVNKVDGTFTENDTQILLTLASQAATIWQVAHLYEDANELFLGFIRALTAAIDAKDPYTVGHSQRVSDFSVAIAQELNLSTDHIHSVRIGSLLHDIGKIGIHDAILAKPGRLSSEEMSEMRKHPSIGYQIIQEIQLLASELPAISEHHERLDGSGYPGKFTDKQLSPIGKIVAVADVFDAMTSDRPYRNALPAKEALDYIQANEGSFFDKESVDALVRAYKGGKIITQQDL